MQTPNHTPLIALPAVVLDLETTGLDIKNDRVLQIGAIGLQGATEQSFNIDQLVNPGIAIPESSTEIHNIDDNDVRDAPSFRHASEMLFDVLRQNVIIGHHIAFDLAILRHEFARHKLSWVEPVSLDVGMLTAALKPNLPDISLETVATLLGVKIRDRHTAMGDCSTTAQCWQKLIPMLQEQNIRTLGEAIALANQRQDLVMRQAQSGWLEMPEGLVQTKLPIAARIDSYVFEHRLADVMTSPPLFISSETSLRNAAKSMVENKVGCLLIGTTGEPPAGIITDSDIMRITASGQHDMDTTTVNTLMSKPVESIHQDEMLYRALARMDRLYIAHLCVSDNQGMPVGIVSQRNLLQYRARSPNMLSDAMDAAKDVHSLAAAYSRVTGVAGQLLAEELDGVEIAQVISTELQALTEHAAELAITQMHEEGMGEPPADWCVLVLGSGGRGESLLSADQDNALIHTGSKEDDAWFANFGQRLAEILDSSGLPLCQGGVMISNAQWRGTLDDWNERITNWINRSRPEDLLNVDIFFDMLPVAGNRSLAQQLHREAVALASRSHAFINLLAQSVQAVAPQFGMLGRLAIVDGRIDLKRNGLLPLVSFARTLALRIGSDARTTAQRLKNAIATGRLSEADAQRLIELQKTLLTLILRQQLEDSEQGVPVGSKVDTSLLDKREHNHLRHELHHLNTMVGEINSFITTN
jgi:DNA polymerase-3 subunit epsilon/CBS domain-containing protein